jgi:hypothetical protein
MGVIIFASSSLPAQAAQSYNYVVSIEASKYVAKTQTGTTAVSGTDFATVMNTLNGLLKTGDVILIRNGVYPVSTQIVNTNKNGIRYIGESLNAVFKATSGNTKGIFKLDNGGSHTGPTDCVVQGLTFDSNFNSVISPSVLISGVRNTVQSCNFINAKQYCLQAWMAQSFQFIYNTFMTAQYAISTGGDSNLYSTGGVIAYNTIKDCSDVGIKLKWVKSTSVHDNNIDTAYITQPLKTSFTPSGIRFYAADGPTIDVTVSNNVIYDSKPTSPQHTAGVFVDKDARGLSTGQKIIGNQITSCYYGVYNKWNNVVIQNNVFTSCKVPITNNGLNTIMSGNVIK